MLTAIIMASGLSRRMHGQNKLLMKYKNRAIFEYTLEAVKNAKVDDMVVVTAFEEIMAYCQSENIRYIYNDNPEVGQSNSIKLGVDHCEKGSDFMFFVADQPLLSTAVIDSIITFYKLNQGCIIVPKYKNTLGNPKIFPNSLREEFLSLTEDVRGSWIVQKHQSMVRTVESSDQYAFFDVDTIVDYKRLI